MNRPFWIKYVHTNLESALIHTENSLPNEVGDICKQTDDEFVCTLFRGHSGDHEAWSGQFRHHTWPNQLTHQTH